MNQKNLKNIIRKLVQEYAGIFKEQLGDVTSQGATSDDGNNGVSPRVGGIYKDDEAEIRAYVLKSIYGGDGGHYRNDSPTFSHNKSHFQRITELEKYIKEVLEELDEQYGYATLTTQGQRKGNPKTKHKGYPGVQMETLKEQQDPRLTNIAKQIQQKNKDIQNLELDSAEINIDIQQSQAAKQLGDATKGINQAKDAEAAAVKRMKETKKFIQQVAAELGQLLQIPLEDLTPEQMTQIDELKAELEKWKGEYETYKQNAKQADEKEQNMIKQNSLASGQAQKSITQARKAYQDQKRRIKKQQSMMASQLMEDYFNQRKNSNLMENIDFYKREILLEKTTSRFFSLFDEGKTDEEILRFYAEQGVVVPEQFVTKLRKKHEGLKHDKLDLEEFEREAKNFKKVPLIDEDEVEIEVKELSSRLFKEEKKFKKKIKEATIKKTYPMPSEIEQALRDDLKMDPIARYVNGLKAVNSIPPSYRIFLHNGQSFDIIYEDFSLMIKIGPEEYYIGSMDEKTYAIKHINRLLTQPTLKKGDVEDEDEGLEDILKSVPKQARKTPPPPSPSPEA
jgi:hypothetical protein